MVMKISHPKGNRIVTNDRDVIFVNKKKIFDLRKIILSRNLIKIIIL